VKDLAITIQMDRAGRKAIAEMAAAARKTLALKRRLTQADVRRFLRSTEEPHQTLFRATRVATLQISGQPDTKPLPSQEPFSGLTVSKRLIEAVKAAYAECQLPIPPSLAGYKHDEGRVDLQPLSGGEARQKSKKNPHRHRTSPKRLNRVASSHKRGRG